MSKNKVIVTGFGPFGEHKINASWEAVKLLPSKTDKNIEIIVEEIPVTYTDVEKKVQELWTQHKPELLIHVGVSCQAEIVTIESQANRCGYIKNDSRGETHPTGVACADGADTIFCQINVKQICQQVNDVYKKNVTCTSVDAGRYLCEYIFYKSLYVDNKRTMFIHVPTLNKPFSASELADIIFCIIQACLLQCHCLCN